MKNQNQDIIIKRAKISDVEDTAHLFNEYRIFYSQSSDIEEAHNFINERLTKNESAIFLASIGDKVVGFAQLYPTFSSISMRRVWILNDMFVLPSHRNFGIGTKLLTAIKNFARETEAKSVVLETSPENITAQKLYEKNGYSIDNEYLHYALRV